LGRTDNPAQLVPVTAPHAGLYLLKTDEQPDQAMNRWKVRRLAAEVLALSGAIRDRAGAVVEIDKARAQSSSAGQGRPYGSMVHAIEQQAVQSSAFIQTLTRYNLAIADYVLAVLPPTTQGQDLAQGLAIVE
jgi:hypothetical protein